MRHSRIARLGLLVAALAIPLHALDLKSLKPQGYVSDFAGVVDPASRAAIAQYAGAVEQATGAQMSFVTLKTLDGDALEDVSIDLFRQFGVGQKGKDNGVQLLLVVDDRRSRMEIGNALEPILPDGLDGQILLDMRPQLRAGNYGQAILAAAQRIGGIIAKDKNVTVAAPVAPTTGQRPAPQNQPSDGFPWGLIIFVMIILIGIFRRGAAARRGGGGFWTGLLIGNLLSGLGGGGRGGFGGSDSGGSSGGFGGSSGGGFGGFGGGDAGGGGASSSW